MPQHPTRRQLAHRRAITDALDLVATARTDPGNGALVEHSARLYTELARATDPTGTAARIGRLMALEQLGAGLELADQGLETAAE